MASPSPDLNGMLMFNLCFFSLELIGVFRPKRFRGDHGDGNFGVFGDMDLVVVG